MCTNLKFHKDDHEVIDWNFFATTHGKWENDELGGNVKNVVWRKTLTVKVVVEDVEDFVELATKKLRSFVIIFCPKYEVRAKSEFLKKSYQTHSKHIQGTHKFHYIDIVDHNIRPELLSPYCPCHQPQYEQPQVIETDHIEQQAIKADCGKF